MLIVTHATLSPVRPNFGVNAARGAQKPARARQRPHNRSVGAAVGAGGAGLAPAWPEWRWHGGRSTAHAITSGAPFMIPDGHSTYISRKEITLANDMNSRTVEGLLAFCDYLKEKHFLGADTVGSWKTAITKVFEGVDGDDYLAADLASVDLDSASTPFPGR